VEWGQCAIVIGLVVGGKVVMVLVGYATVVISMIGFVFVIIVMFCNGLVIILVAVRDMIGGGHVVVVWVDRRGQLFHDEGCDAVGLGHVECP